MPSAARQPLGGWRNEACLIPITVPGVDLTGKPIRAQLRPTADNPVLTLDLPETADPGATGVRLVSVTVDASGTPTSNLMWQITKAAMQALPFGGEIGDPWVGAYALQIDGHTQLYGPFGALASPIDSDAAPANRPSAIGLPSADWGGSTGVTLTIGAGGVTVSIYGMAEIQAALAKALAASVASAASATIAAAARDAAQAWAQGAAPGGLLTRSAKGWADVASRDAAYADQMRAAVVAALAGHPAINGALLMQAIDRPTLKGFTGMAAGAQAWLAETGRVGAFQWMVGDYSAKVTQDDREAIFIAANSVPSSQGAWVRMLTGFVFMATWWGLTPDVQDAEPILQEALNAIPIGSTLVLPPFELLFPNPNVNLIVGEGTRLTGFGNKTWLHYTGPTAGLLSILQCAFSNIEIDHLRITWRNPRLGTGNPAAIMVGTRVGGTGKGPLRLLENYRFHDLLIDNTSLGIITFVADDDTGIVTSRNADIHDIVIRHNCQAVSLFGMEDVRLRHFLFQSDKTDGNVYAPSLRILGARNPIVSDGHIVGAGQVGANVGVTITAMSTRTGGGPQFRQRNRNVTLDNVTFEDCNFMATVEECEGQALLHNCRLYNDPASAAVSTGVRVGSDGVNADLPIVLEDVRVESCIMRGIALGLYFYGASRTLEFSRNKLIGNAYQGTSPSMSAAVYTNWAYGGPRRVRITENDFLMQCIAGGDAISLDVAPAGTLMEVWGNTFPETAGALMTYGTGFSVSNAYSRTSPGGPLLTGQSGVSTPWGENAQHPVGALEQFRSGAVIPAPVLPLPAAWSRNLPAGISETSANIFTRTAATSTTGYDLALTSTDPITGDFELVYRLKQLTPGIAVGVDVDGGDARLAQTDWACSYEQQDVGGSVMRGTSVVYAHGNQAKVTGPYTPGIIERWARKGSRLSLQRGGSTVFDTYLAPGPMRMQVALLRQGDAIEILRYGAI